MIIIIDKCKQTKHINSNLFSIGPVVPMQMFTKIL